MPTCALTEDHPPFEALAETDTWFRQQLPMNRLVEGPTLLAISPASAASKSQFKGYAPENKKFCNRAVCIAIEVYVVSSIVAYSVFG